MRYAPARLQSSFVLRAMLLVVGIAACGAPALVPPPPVAGSERFQVTTRNGSDLPDDEYAAFYAEVVRRTGAERHGLTLSIALGDRGSTVTAVSLAGHPPDELVPTLGLELFGGVPPREATIEGIRVFARDETPGRLAFPAGSTLYLIEARSAAHALEILAAIHRRLG